MTPNVTLAPVPAPSPARIATAPATNGSTYWLYVCLLSALGMLASFSIDTYLPAFPAIAREFHVRPEFVQQTLTLYLVTFAVAMLFYGTLSDTYGRRRVILLAVAGFIVGAAGAGFAGGIGSLLIFRAVQGTFSGAGSVIGRAVVRDLYPGREGERLMAHIGAVFGVAPAVAPILGGWLLTAFGWRSIFYFLTAVSLLIFLACGKSLPETLPKSERTPFRLGEILRQYRQVGSHAGFIFQCLAGGLIFSGVGIYVSAAPDFVNNVLHLPATAFGWLFLPIIVGMTLGSILAGRLAGRMPSDKIAWVALSIQGLAALVNVGYMWLVPCPAVPWAVAPLFVYSFGFALASPVMTLRALDLFPAVRGLASSLQSFVQMMMFAAVSGLMAPLVYGSGLKISLVLAAAWLGAVVCWWIGTGKRADQ